MIADTRNAAVQLLQFGLETFILPTIQAVVVPALQTAYTNHRNIALWMESQATIYFNARIGAVVYNTIMTLPTAVVLFTLPPWLVNGAIVGYTVGRVCSDCYDDTGASSVIEPLLGMHFLLSATARLGISILHNGNPELAASAAVQAFIGITYLPIH